MFLLYIGIAVLALMFMITVHEFGHYLSAKLLKFRVTEFAIGFGKPIFKHVNKKTGEIFSIRLIPLGGYCAFEGQDDPIVGEKKDGKNDTKHYITDKNELHKTLPKYEKKGVPFDKQHPWKRLVVLFSGAFANFICGVVFCIILVGAIGYYQTVTINVDPRSHLAPVLRDGDVVSAIGSTRTNGEQFTMIENYNKKFDKFKNNVGAGNSYFLTVTHTDGTSEIVEVWRDLIYDASGNPYKVGGVPSPMLGITFVGLEYTPLTFGEWFEKGFVLSGEFAVMILNALGQMVTGQIALTEMGGTFSTIAVMGEAMSAPVGGQWYDGFVNLLILIPLISINLAVFNLLPVPALDGARMVFVAIEWVRRKPVNPELENKIHTIGIMCLLGLIIFLDINFLIFQRLLGG